MLFAQKQGDYIKYYQYTSEGDFFFHTQEYDSAVVYFEKGMSYVEVPHPAQVQRYAQSRFSCVRAN